MVGIVVQVVSGPASGGTRNGQLRDETAWIAPTVTVDPAGGWIDVGVYLRHTTRVDC
ncbi:TPA: hypothetical protein QDB05_003631 [Burkholderia vietnamiensis]|nr:hypothetical protein [Burkholderia vietnamiensis]